MSGWKLAARGDVAGEVSTLVARSCAFVGCAGNRRCRTVTVVIPSPTVLGYSRTDRAVIVAGFPLAGIAVGALLPVLARWMLGWHTPLPMRVVVKAVGSVDRFWEVVVHLAIWGVVGACVAAAALRDGAVVELTDGELRVRRDGGDRVVPRQDVFAVFADGPAVVVLDRSGRQLLRERLQVTGRVVAEGFTAHGFPWSSRDPFADRFQPWTPGDGKLAAAGLPAAGEELLRARRAVLGKDARRADDLRVALQELGIVVREHRTDQSWRRLDTRPSS